VHGGYRNAFLGVALVAALVQVPPAERALRDVVAAGRDARHVDGVRVLDRWPGATDLVLRVRQVVPEDAEVRIVFRGESCGLIRRPVLRGLVFWLQYELLPRPVSCDEDEPWQIWVQTDPPPGAEVVAPGYAIVRRP
jgi:hypothetical protein